MKRIAIAVCLAALTLPLVFRLRADDRKANVLLEAGLSKETIQGDPRGAIEQYAKAFKEAGANRVLAAKALLRMAECYEKLGDAQARKIFEQVVQKYPDQKDVVAAARARLGGAAQTVAVLAGSWGGPSYDGRYLVGGGPNGFTVRDLSTNTDRSTPADGRVIRRARLTPDGKKILYYWRKEINPVNVPAELRIVNVDGTGVRTLIPARDYIELEAASVTQDGKIAAVNLEHRDGKAWDLALLTIETGRLQILKTFRDVFTGNFSPDGRWLVYASLPDAPGSKDAGVYTLATDGSGAVNALASSAKLSAPFFTPDGSRVAYLVIGEGGDHVDLWSVKTANGKPVGDPELRRARVVDGAAFIPKDMQPGAFGMGFDSAGSYYLSARSETSALYVSTRDQETDRWVQQRISDPARRPFVTQPKWSPDGTSLAYLSNIAEAIIIIRNMGTGEEREIRTGATALDLIGWQPDGKSLEVDSPLIGHLLIDIEGGQRKAASGTVRASSANASQQDTRPGGGQVANVIIDQPRSQTFIFKGLFGK
jgi:Tol biopolymer transport system component